MIYIVSPAKSLNFSDKSNAVSDRTPNFINESEKLIKELKKFSPEDICSLMKISEKLGELNFYRFQQYELNPVKEAIFAFHGDVYKGLDINSLKEEAVLYGDKHLRILSGLYGVLRPLDRIKEHRLEMGTKLKNKAGKDLYEFWGDKILEFLDNELSKEKTKVLVNLASEEYSKAAKIEELKKRYKVITPVFKDYKNGSYKIISIYAKRARGLMARYLIENEVDNIKGIKEFECEGYKYSEEKSNEDFLVFIRN
ncbi:peroxide stress protein YaaA [Clostridium intestinale]|uniref:UPF0246 protein CINTURNW_0970 n=1 Tax=Clostridium intestinale URNW TaxID=1294142 RepID=U2N8P8_9CLOT|nr:peroxide stress protein YaaA [Clostridium intestinale]ERK31892.1 hypothetical protein CINTURNW_0970 [Clostridium intestinale URNW]